jgi:hypothetical protein
MVHLLYVVILLGLISTFRPVVMVMIVTAIFIGFTLSKRKYFYTYVVILAFIAGFIFLGSDIWAIKNSVSTSSDTVALSQNLTPNLFNYSNAILASLAGPLPTYLPIIEREQQAFYATGLGFRMFLTTFFILGILKIRKERDIFLLAIGVFTLIEMASLAIILESFELRFSAPHYPFVYIIAYYYLYKHHSNLGVQRNKNVILLSTVGISLLIVVWNLRF